MNSSVSSAFLWKLMERVGYQGALLVVQIALARLLSPDDFGILAIMLVFVNLSTCFVQSGFNTALVQSKETTRNDYSTVFWASAVIALILYIVIFLFSPAIADFYGNESIKWPLRILSLVLFVNAYNSVQVAYVVKTLEMRKIFSATLVSVCTSGLISVVVAFFGMGIWALVCQQLVYQLCSCVVLAHKVPWRPHFVFDYKRAKRLFSFGWKILVSSLVNMGYQDVSDLVVGKVYSAAGLGYFNQGKKLPQVVSKVFESSVQPVMLAAVSRFQNDLGRVAQAIRKSVSLCSFLLVPLLVWMYVSSEQLIVLVFSEKWIPCVPYMQVFCSAYITWPILTCVVQGLNAVGRSEVTLKLSIVRSVVGLVFLIGAIALSDDPLFVAASFAIALAVSAFINAIVCCKVIGFAFLSLLSDVLPIYCAGAVSGIVAGSLSSLASFPNVTIVAINFVGIAATYLLIAHFMKFDSARYVFKSLSDFIGSFKRKGKI